jgi:S1-C subfamily serine protease
MRLSVTLAAVLVCAAGGVIPPAAAAQQPVSAPGSNGAVSAGFTHDFPAGVMRTDSGWTARAFPRVSAVVAGSAAARAGLHTGDLIVAVNGRDARRPPLFARIRRGTDVVMRVRRGDEEREIRYRIE